MMPARRRPRIQLVSASQGFKIFLYLKRLPVRIIREAFIILNIVGGKLGKLTAKVQQYPSFHRWRGKAGETASLLSPARGVDCGGY